MVRFSKQENSVVCKFICLLQTFILQTAAVIQDVWVSNLFQGVEFDVLGYNKECSCYNSHFSQCKSEKPKLPVAFTSTPIFNKPFPFTWLSFALNRFLWWLFCIKTAKPASITKPDLEIVTAFLMQFPLSSNACKPITRLIPFVFESHRGIAHLAELQMSDTILEKKIYWKMNMKELRITICVQLFETQTKS